MKGTGATPDAISIVIPAHNEETAIAKTLSQLATILQDVTRPAEVIVVNDGSEDRTAVLAEEAGVRVIYHPTNLGYGRGHYVGGRAGTLRHDCDCGCRWNLSARMSSGNFSSSMTKRL